MERSLFVCRLHYFLELCVKGKTGTIKEVAQRLNMSESGVKRMINDIRNSGIDIKFDHSLKSYISNMMLFDSEKLNLTNSK